MKEQKKSSQQIYRVRVYKDFDFPSFSIDKKNKLEDLTYNAMHEVKQSVQNGGNLDFEIVNILPFTLKTEEHPKTGNTDYDFFTREIALMNTANKYGDLSFEKSPQLYQKIDDRFPSVVYNLLPDVEDFYLKEVKKISNLLAAKIVRR